MKLIESSKNKARALFNRCQWYWLSVFALNPTFSYALDIETIVNRTTSYLQGGLARSMGVLTIVVCGYLCLAQNRFPKQYFILVLLGMGLIFGASALYSRLIA